MNTPNEATQTASPSLAVFLRQNMREYGILIALVVIMVFFQVITHGVLFRPVNLTNLVLQNSFVVIMALGMLLVIVAGHIDLSVGSIVAIIGAVAAVMMVNYKIDPWTTSLVCLILGGAIGAAQGYWVAYHHIPAFIVTLAGMLIFRGLTLWLLGGMNIGPFPIEFQRLSTGFVPDFTWFFGSFSFSIPWLQINSFFIALNDQAVGPFDIQSTFIEWTIVNTSTLLLTLCVILGMVYSNYRSRQINLRHGIEVEPGIFFVIQNLITSIVILFVGLQLSTYKGIPNILVVMGVLVVFYVFITTRTTIGRRIYALGGNEKATRLSGINTERLSFYTFINMGVLAGFAGLIVAARLNSSTPKAGNGFELDVIAACFIGGASTTGGVGKITGAVVGAFIMGVLNNGMSIMGLGIDFQQMVKGAVLLAAVVFDLYNKQKG
ncbi:multiple monosaccharide ABC transporter permease [Pleomorphomonas oryzae]|uniref:multiple monosaccharide ABC transporter permease n=1 Tax=Pleomorphomonas oryzae TaxID=261934 RepID=UPI000407ADF1|nr:multiple monosaccharide ABC transporter permease [Pleomorphomonas oryzae]